MRQKGFIPIVIILVLVGLGFLGYFTFFNKYWSRPLNIPTNSSMPPAVIAHLKDFQKVDTTGWKKITVNKTGFGGVFQFLIPANVLLCDPTSRNSDGPPIPDSFESISRYNIISEDNSKCLHPTMFLNNDKFPYGIRIEWTYLTDVPPLSNAGFLKYDIDRSQKSDFGFGDQETYLLTGERDISYTTSPTSDVTTKKTYYERLIFNKGSQIMVFTIETNPNKDNLDIYRQILSTFKFAQ